MLLSKRLAKLETNLPTLKSALIHLVINFRWVRGEEVRNGTVPLQKRGRRQMHTKEVNNLTIDDRWCRGKSLSPYAFQIRLQWPRRLSARRGRIQMPSWARLTD